MRKAALVAFTLLALVAAAGCTGAADPGSDDTALQADRAGSGGQASGTPGADGAPGAPGTPGPGGPDGNARAPGSPITIPKFTQIGGQPVDKVRAEIEAAIREACTPRHDLCVTTVVEAVAAPGEVPNAHACFGGTKPATNGTGKTVKVGEEVRVPLGRDSVLTIYSVQPDCGDSESESSSSSTESSDTTQVPPSSDTESSESTGSDAGPPSS